ncbi:hypothetical protein HIV01_000600 [Lysobacter arenosi]|jgi:hypothetical protein|uniref:DUF4279 domain-containing protein n=1 Tax=Lysobacter arenosi TaxID=2795387 RepID=A0ABX7RAD9_9GAMM|nr:hypothetical protein [Lysobacter arenosi]QSX75112.1 hypothetical protein HIV01_000600 [Lysobacter arenosi]
MSGCVLRAAGSAFSPESFLAAFPLPEANHRGNALNVVVSDRDGADLAGQVRDALAFLQLHAPAVRALLAMPGVEASLDFGLWRKDTLSQSVLFPPTLTAFAGELGLGLEVSLYVATPPRSI